MVEMRQVYETDNGPGGLSWELHEDGRWVASLRRDYDIGALAPVEVLTLADWERDPESTEVALTIAPILTCGFCQGVLTANGDGGYSHADAAEGFDCADASGDEGIVPWPIEVEA